LQAQFFVKFTQQQYYEETNVFKQGTKILLAKYPSSE